VRRFGVSVLVLSILATACASYHVTDAALVSAFEKNRTLFDELASVSMSGELNCPYRNDPNICESQRADAILARLKGGTGFKGLESYIKNGPTRVLWVPVETKGYLSMSSSTVGYVYSSTPLSPLVGSVWDDFEDRQAYKNIYGSWYVFVTN